MTRTRTDIALDAVGASLLVALLATLVAFCAGCATGSGLPPEEHCSALCLADRARADARHCGCADLCAHGLCGPEVKP